MPDAFAQLFLQLHNPKTTNTNKSVDPTKIHSSRSIALKHLAQRERELGEEWPILQKKAQERRKSRVSEEELTEYERFKGKKL